MHRFFVVVGMVLVALSCGSDDNGSTKDSGLVPDLVPQPDVKGVVMPFGKSCDNLGQPCQEADPRGFELLCIGVQGGTEGKGFCSPTCSSMGSECYGVPNGQWAQCILQQNIGDAGPGTMYCAFLCKADDKSWTCPGELKCGETNDQGAAICLP